jgi:hypothetical protein
LLDKDGIPKKRKVGIKLINLAINENKPKDQHFLQILEDLKSYYSFSNPNDQGDNRNSVSHGFIHPRFWSKESFENLIQVISKLSKYAGF